MSEQMSGALRAPPMTGRSAWSSGRFTVLQLQHNEYYFRRHDAVALLPPALAGTERVPVAVPDLRPSTGVLHVCSKSVFFEPSDVTAPIVRLPLAQVDRFTPWEPDAVCCQALRDYGVVVGSGVRSQAEKGVREHRGAAGEVPRTGSHAPTHGAGGGGGRWFAGWREQLLPWVGSGSRRASASDHSDAGAAACSVPVVHWALCRMDAQEVGTLLARNQCARDCRVVLQQPLFFAIKQVEQSTADSADRASGGVNSVAGVNGARCGALECSTLITLLLADQTVKHECQGGGTPTPWAAKSETLRRLIKEHELAGLALLPAAAMSGGNQRVLCHGRAERVFPLAEIPGRLCLTDKHLFFRPFSGGEESEEQMALINVLRVARRRYQLQHTAIEFVFKGSGGSALYRFQSARDCELVWRHLSAQHADERREWEKVCAAWQAGAISNYHYLMFLNGMGDRSENDLSQYPVMPWVLADYASETINLDDAGIYRDLARPMGALDQSRLARLVRRYHSMERPRYLYGTHYSAPAHVLYYLVRAAPQQSLRLHGGRFDVADRTFVSLEKTWRACSGANDADVKELTPEFFHGKGAFLENRLGLDLGVTQEGERVGHVQLPPWAAGSVMNFVSTNRRALESQHVSARLHLWVDLIFGQKQRGAEAKAALNLFHPLTYEGCVDLAAITDESQQVSRCKTASSSMRLLSLSLFLSVSLASPPFLCYTHTLLHSHSLTYPTCIDMQRSSSKACRLR